MEGFIREILMVMPGAFIRWLYLYRKKTFNEILEEDTIYNTILSFVFIGFVVLFLILIF